MQKHILAILVIVLSLPTGTAKAQLHNTIMQKDYSLRVSVYDQQFFNISKATGNRSRLMHMAIGYYDNGSFPAQRDSITLRYYGQRGWDEALDEWAFDMMFNYGGGPMIKDYGIDDRLDTQQFVKSGWPYRNVYSYTPNGKIATISEDSRHPSQNLWAPKDRYKYYYDNAGRRIAEILQGTDSTVIAYGPDGEISRESYPPGAINPPILQGWYTRYVSGKVFEIVLKESDFPPATPKEVIRWRYIYGSTGKVDTNYVYHPGFEPDTRDTTIYAYTYNNDGYILTSTRQNRNGSVDSNIEKIEIAYNYLNQVISEKYLTFDQGSNSWVYSHEHRFHYAPLFPSDIPGQQSATRTPTLQVFPVPACGRISVMVQAIGAGEAAVSICRMDGTIVHKLTCSNSTHTWKHDLDLSVLPAGNYLLLVEGSNGTAVKQFVLK
jgi:hypothetical protein